MGLELPWDYLLRNVNQNTVQDAFKNIVDERFSISNGKGVAQVSSNQDLTAALGAADIGARLWMQSGGNQQAFEAEMNKYIALLNTSSIGAISLGATNTVDFNKSLKNNMARGAAVAKGLGLNSLTQANYNTAARGIVTKANEGYFYDRENKPFKAGDKIGGRLTAVSFSDAKKKQQSPTPKR
jgi:hypothetical protein